MQFIAFVPLIIGAVACGERIAVQCEEDSNCDLSGGGRCIAASTGSMWCAYPDDSCPGGYRYSDVSVGEGLSEACVGALADAGVDTTPMPDAGKRSWSTPALVANVNTTADERAPAISSDGLELYFGRFSGLNPPYGEIFVARRSSTTQPFGEPAPVAEVNGSNSNEIFAVPGHSGLELFVSVAGIITRYTRATSSSQWANPTNTGITASFVSQLSPDDLTMYFVARCPMEAHGGAGPCFFYSMRASIGAAFSNPVYVPWDGNTQWQGATVSPNGLYMLASGNASGVSGVAVVQQERATITAPWSSTQVISALALETTNHDLQWNADATEIYLTAKPTSNVSNGDDIYVSVQQ